MIRSKNWQERSYYLQRRCAGTSSILRLFRRTERKEQEKAAETRARKQQKSQGDCENSVKCGVCSKDWQEETEEVEDWIQCEMCNHWQCQNIFGSVAPEEFVRTKCQN